MEMESDNRERGAYAERKSTQHIKSQWNGKAAVSIGKRLQRPFGIMRSAVMNISDRWKYSSSDGYDAERYWQDRHSKYGASLRGVGNKGLSEDRNRQMYLEAKNVFVSLCRDLKVDFEKSKILDVGCGGGFYAEIFKEHGCTDYLGIDIVNVLFDRLNIQFPNFRFRILDITTENLDDFYDLIVMIDVTQHITTDKKFTFAMQNIKSHLSDSGVFIVTSWLKDGVRNSYYEVSRSLDRYKKQFEGCEFSEAVPFRDKFIFAITKHGQ